MHLDAVLERLQEVGLQSDERFAEMFVRYKANKGQGPARSGISCALNRWMGQ